MKLKLLICSCLILFNLKSITQEQKDRVLINVASEMYTLATNDGWVDADILRLVVECLRNVSDRNRILNNYTAREILEKISAMPGSIMPEGKVVYAELNEREIVEAARNLLKKNRNLVSKAG